MLEPCREYREGQEREGFTSLHAESCPDCAAWARARARMRAALADLERVVAPAALEARLADELGGDRSRRLTRALSSLVRRGAPAALERRLAERLTTADEECGARTLAVLRTLDVQRAPAVLERLVAEELAAPERTRAERFPGSLARLPAPALLAERLDARVRRRALVRAWIGPVSALSAAGLVIWMALQSDVPEPREYRFEVRHAASLDGLDPVARLLGESLGGGEPR